MQFLRTLVRSTSNLPDRNLSTNDAKQEGVYFLFCVYRQAFGNKPVPTGRLDCNNSGEETTKLPALSEASNRSSHHERRPRVSTVHWPPAVHRVPVGILYHDRCASWMRRIRLLWEVALYVAVEHKEPTEELRYRSYLVPTQGMGMSKKEELCAMEEEIYRAVGSSLDLASPMDFLRRNCNAAKASEQEHLTALNILELCLVDFTMAWMKPSKKAASALYYAMRLHGKQNLWYAIESSLSFL
ncbi:G2/mitotic-specific cyclin-B3-like [Amblyomma americanum]